MAVEQSISLYSMDACPERESLCPHAIAHAQNDLFAAVANLFVARLGGTLRRKASLDCESHIWVTRLVGLPHLRITT